MPEKKIAGLSFIDHKKMYEETKRLFDQLHMNVDPRTQAIELSSSVLQLGAVSYTHLDVYKRQTIYGISVEKAISRR